MQCQIDSGIEENAFADELRLCQSKNNGCRTELRAHGLLVEARLNMQPYEFAWNVKWIKLFAGSIVIALCLPPIIFTYEIQNLLALFSNNRLCILVVRVPGNRPTGPGFDSGCYQIFWIAVCLEPGPLNIVRMNEEQLEREVAAPV
jgi:hypothetical protein